MINCRPWETLMFFSKTLSITGSMYSSTSWNRKGVPYFMDISSCLRKSGSLKDATCKGGEAKAKNQLTCQTQGEKKILGGSSGCVSTLKGGREKNRRGTEAGCGTCINPEIHEGQAPSSLIRKHSSAAKGDRERTSPVVQ